MFFNVVETNHSAQMTTLHQVKVKLLYYTNAYNFNILSCNYTGFNYPQSFNGWIPLWF